MQWRIVIDASGRQRRPQLFSPSLSLRDHAKPRVSNALELDIDSINIEKE